MRNLISHPLFSGGMTAADRLWKEAFLEVSEPEIFSVDITTDDKSIKLKAEIPGVKKEDISVELNDGILTIKAEKKQESEKDSRTMIQKESYYGSMQRSFSVGTVEADDVKASYTDGVLSITLSRKTEDFKKINIE
jgi:HSP20 family protein